MKRKYLLTLLPALLVLSACAGVGQKTNKNYAFQEDALAHEELFNQGQDGGFRQIRKILTPDPAAPYLGMQVSPVLDGKFAIRFIAAVTIGTSDEDVASASARWTRTIYNASGYQYNAESHLDCVASYTSITDNGDELTIAEFNAAKGTTHDHFVAYTIKNIPVDTYDNYYIKVSISVNGAASSDILGTTINREKQVTFSPSQEGKFFMRGRIGGVDNSVFVGNTSDPSNHAIFDKDLAANDSFVIVYNDTEENRFEIFNYSAFTGGGITGGARDTSVSSYFENASNKIKVLQSLNYVLYLNTTNKIWAAPYEVPSGYYLKGSMNSWAQSAAYEFVNDKSGNKAKMLSIELKDGDQFKVWQDTGGDGTWYGWPGVSNASSDPSWFTGGYEGDNITCHRDGTYTIFLNGSNKVWINEAE